MAVAIEQKASSVLIVTAPTVDDLTAVHGALELPDDVGIATDEGRDETESTATDEQETLGGDTPEGGAESDRSNPSEDDDGVGFGVVVAALAVLLTALGEHTRRRW